MAYDILTPTGTAPTGTAKTAIRSSVVSSQHAPHVVLSDAVTGDPLDALPIELSATDAGTQDAILAALLALPVDGLTDAELRASPVPVSGPVTDAQIRATPIIVDPVIDEAALDLFGRMRTTEPFVVFASSPACGLDPRAWQTLTSGAGNTLTWSEPYRAAIFTLAAAGYVVRQSYRYIPYELGRPVRLVLTGNAGNDISGVTRNWGQFDAANGVMWRRKDDGTMAVAVRSSTTGSAVDLVINQADWNGEAVTFDPALQQVYIIEYVWLGGFAVRWGIATDPANVRYVHTQKFFDELPSSYMQTACLPMRWEIHSSGVPSSPALMQSVCSMLESEGGYAIAPAFTFAARRTIAAAIAAGTAPTEAPIVAIRPALTIGPGPITNRVQAAIQDIEVYSTAGADWSLWYFPPGNGDPLTGGSWAAVNDISSIEANASATAVTLTGGYRIASGFAVTSGTGGGARGAVSAAIQQTLPLTLDICGVNNPLTSNVGANPGYLVLTASGTGSVAGVINWKEIR
jgi:hypothetical protein